MKQNPYPDLGAMRNVDIRDFDPNTIPYAKDIHIDTELSKIDRVLDFIDKAKNPYFYRSENGILVQIEYSETETTIEDCMGLYFELISNLHKLDK